MKKQCAFWIQKNIIDRKKEQFKQIDFSTVNRILFIRHDGKFGDYIISSFIYRELKKQNPNLRIDLLATENLVPIIQKNSFIDRIIVSKKRTFSHFWKLGKILSKNHYDVVIDLTEHFRNRDLLLLRKINAKYNITYDKNSFSLCNANIDKNNFHVSQNYLLALNKMGIHLDEINYDIPFDESRTKLVNQFIKKEIKAPFIIVNFFAASRKKSFNDESKLIFLKKLNKEYFDRNEKIVLLCEPKKMKHFLQFFENTKKTLKKETFFVYENIQNMFDSIALINQAELVISTDTSIVHIASGLNKKLIAFYKNDPSAFAKWQPKTKNKCKILMYSTRDINESMHLIQENSFVL